MIRYFFFSEMSRKARTVRQAYEHLKNRVDKESWIPSIVWGDIEAEDGIPVPKADRSRFLALKLQDEHLSPYVKTDMNLFQMHMLGDAAEMKVFRAPHGWLIEYDGVSDGPQPFGNAGFDTR